MFPIRYERNLLCLHFGQPTKRHPVYRSDTDLTKRVYEHKNGLVDGFTKKYGVHRLVYYEVMRDAETALSREKQMKKWNRVWKLKLIEEQNPEWLDLYKSLLI